METPGITYWIGHWFYIIITLNSLNMLFFFFQGVYNSPIAPPQKMCLQSNNTSSVNIAMILFILRKIIQVNSSTTNSKQFTVLILLMKFYITKSPGEKWIDVTCVKSTLL